jgi:hypothetical protein
LGKGGFLIFLSRGRDDARRGDWLLVAALAGIALATSSSVNAKDGSKQPSNEQAIATSLAQITTADVKASELKQRADQDAMPCGERNYGSSAELCAQWKAADAAADSAWWAWVSGLVGLGSLAGVLIAIGLTYQSNRIARDTAKRQLRAYISVEPKGVFARDDDGWILMPVAIKNSGQTPAKAVQIESWFGLVESPEWFDARKVDRKEGYTVESAMMVPPNEESFAYVRVPFNPTPAAELEIRNGKVGFVHVGKVVYQDVFGHPQATTFANYHRGPDLSDAHAKRCLFGNDAT